MTFITTTNSVEDTLDVAAKLAARLRAGDCVELVGDLGSGKTHFVKGLAAGLGYKGEVTSPTFTISQIYSLPGDRHLYHFDFYRLAGDHLIAGELGDALADPQGIVVTEWGQTMHAVLPLDRFRVSLEASESGGRQIKIEGPSSRLEGLK